MTDMVHQLQSFESWDARRCSLDNDAMAHAQYCDWLIVDCGKINQKEMSILTCGDNVINRNVQFDDLILILFIYSNFDDLILILVIFLILMILF